MCVCLLLKENVLELGIAWRDCEADVNIAFRYGIEGRGVVRSVVKTTKVRRDGRREGRKNGRTVFLCCSSG